MDQPNQFRSAFNGFNRDDVVRYLEFMNNKHSAQVAQLNNELEYLRKKQETVDFSHVNALEEQAAALRAENDALKARIAELESSRPTVDDQTRPLPSSAELEAYRRAERVERIAKERANQISEQTTTALTEAGAKVDSAAGEIANISGQILEQLNLLKDAMEGSQQAFQDASGVVAKLHSEL